MSSAADLGAENKLRWKLSSRFVLHDFQYEMVMKFKTIPNALCGDDMGLGKTYEGIALDRLKRLLAGYPTGFYAKTLVVTTKSMIGTWREEYAKTMPNMEVVTIDPKNRSTFEMAVTRGEGDIFVCHWDVLRMMPVLTNRVWFHVIADEVHKIKNRKTQVTHALKKIKTTHKLGLSGTPADNKPDDLWSVLNWLYPKKFTSYWSYVKQFCEFVELETKDGNGYRKMTGIRNEKMLQREMAPFFIRRRKEEVLKDLPDKYYTQVWVDLSPTQRRAYDAMRKEQLAWVGKNLDQPVAAPVAIAQLVRLQQFALGNIRIDEVQKTFRNKLFDPARLEEEYDPFDPKGKNWKLRKGIVTEYHIEDPSPKCDMAMEIIGGTNQSIVLFTGFRDVAWMMAHRLKQAGITYGVITGEHSKVHRDRVRESFQAGRTQVFVGTFAAREGITLHRSSTEIFLDRVWSPSWNRQAEDRCHRIGQKNAVQVIDIMARNTVDLGRHQQFQQKWTWLQMMFGDKTLDYQKQMQEEAA